MPSTPTQESSFPVKGAIFRLEDVLAHPPQRLGTNLTETGGVKWTVTHGASDLHNSFSSRVIYASRSIKVSELVDQFAVEQFDTEGLNLVIDTRGPSVQLYQRLARNLKLEPEECMVLEATESGTTAARAAGIGLVVGLRTGHANDANLSRAHYVVDDPSLVTFNEGRIILRNATPGAAAEYLDSQGDHGLY